MNYKNLIIATGITILFLFGLCFMVFLISLSPYSFPIFLFLFLVFAVYILITYS